MKYTLLRALLLLFLIQCSTTLHAFAATEEPMRQVLPSPAVQDFSAEQASATAQPATAEQGSSTAQISAAEQPASASQSSAQALPNNEEAPEPNDSVARVIYKDTGDMLVTSLGGEPNNLLPFMSSDASSHAVAEMFFIAPLKYDKNLEIKPWAAESYEVLDDGLRLRFTLKKGIMWSDGVEFTAEDVEFTYRLMIDPATPTAYGGDFKAVKTFTLLDRYSFEVTYEKPYARSLTTWMMAIMPKHALEGHDLKKTPLARNPVSSGPFVLKEWLPGSRVTIAANHTYFEGRPFLDAIMYRIIPDPTTAFLEMKAGKLDVIGSLTPYQFAFQATKPEFADKFNIHRWLGNVYTYLGYNLKSPLFSDKRVRQALAYAIDKEAIINMALFGQGVSTIGPYKPGSWVYNEKIQDREYNPEKALALFKEAGWQHDASGKLMKGNIPFEFTVLVDQGNETRIKIAVILQEQFRNLGIRMKIRTVEWAAFVTQFVSKGYFDAVVLGWTIPMDPDAFNVWHSSSGGTLNFIGYNNSEVDALLEKARSTFDQSKRKVFYDRFQEILHDEQPYTFLFVPYTLAAVDKRFKGLEDVPAGIFYNLQDWWVPSPLHRHTR